MSEFSLGFMGGVAGGIVMLWLGAEHFRRQFIAELDKRRLEVLGPNSTRADALELL